MTACLLPSARSQVCGATPTMGTAFSKGMGRATKAVGAAMGMEEKGASPTDEITEVQLEEFKAAFQQFDSDRSGYIDLEELRKLCAWVGQDVSDADLNDMMDLGEHSPLPCLVT